MANIERCPNFLEYALTVYTNLKFEYNYLLNLECLEWDF